MIVRWILPIVTEKIALRQTEFEESLLSSIDCYQDHQLRLVSLIIIKYIKNSGVQRICVCANLTSKKKGFTPSSEMKAFEELETL